MEKNHRIDRRMMWVRTNGASLENGLEGQTERWGGEKGRTGAVGGVVTSGKVMKIWPKYNSEHQNLCHT